MGMEVPSLEFAVDPWNGWDPRKVDEANELTRCVRPSSGGGGGGERWTLRSRRIELPVISRAWTSEQWKKDP